MCLFYFLLYNRLLTVLYRLSFNLSAPLTLVASLSQSGCLCIALSVSVYTSQCIIRHVTASRDVLRSAARTQPVHQRLLHLLAALISASVNTNVLHTPVSMLIIARVHQVSITLARR